MPETDSQAVAFGLHHFIELSSELLEKGLSIRFRAHGRSMRPAIRDGDIITVQPVAPASIRKGDVLLCRWNQSLAAHRVVDIARRKRRSQARGGTSGSHPRFFLRGDASGTLDEPVGPIQIMGKVVYVERDGRRISLDHLKVRWVFRASSAISIAMRWIKRPVMKTLGPLCGTPNEN